MFRIEGIDHVALAVRDVEISVAWYTQVLGLTRLHQNVWGSFPAVVGVGTTALALFPVEGTNPQPPPNRDALTMRHVAFRVSRADFDRARAELPRQGIPVEFQNHGIAHSIYFHDPDGYELELTTYEIDQHPA